MTLQEAIKARHSVRRYTDRPIEKEKLDAIRGAIAEANAASGLNIQLVLNEPRAFGSSNFLHFQYGVFRGVRNYLVMAGRNDKATKEKIGYYGEGIVLLAQTLGLNTCWVGLTYKEVFGAFKLRPGEKVHCVIPIGYGETQGVQHNLRTAQDFIEAEPHLHVPDWFLEGIKAVILAPSAVNQQKYAFSFEKGSLAVSARAKFSLIGYTAIDLGIAKRHFEIGAGPGNFIWKK
ncbi:MAG: nitroreductase [Bacteroidales bacterium]|nr:nitroreductase [Bacteroidales bacterium]